MYSISYEKKLCWGNQTFSKSTLHSKQDQTDHEDADAEKASQPLEKRTEAGSEDNCRSLKSRQGQIERREKHMKERDTELKEDRGTAVEAMPRLQLPMPDLQLLRLDYAPALLAFEQENRAYFAASIPDRGDEFFAEFDTLLAQLLAWQAARTDYFHLLVTERGEVMGRVNLTEVAEGSAELGYRIAQKAAGQGLATAAVRKVRALAATEYGLSRLRARVTLDNPASRKVLEHNGFVAGGSLTLNGKPARSYICELR